MKQVTPERWQRIEAILDEVLELPQEAQAAYLDEVCSDDPDLRAEVVKLLQADAESDWFIDNPVDEMAAAAVAEFKQERATPEIGYQPGKLIGPYRIVRELGRGGMGAVFLAERVDGAFEQQVAVKLIRRGMDTDLILQRFLRERQILARLQHPNIARLLDGGITDEQYPYFAMEYAEGVPITTYCDERQLGVEARLQLFQDVGWAVQYAHRNLIVHRDLKPSNILVTGEGEVKLLDFGIAKLLADEETEDELTLTRTNQRLLTPGYAAPEQVLGEPITTATDVYGLGVVLYELLTGQRPHHAEKRISGTIEQLIVEQEPVRPSTAIRKAEEDVSQARGTNAEKLRRRLSGDLDTILLMALRKEPERRYASVEGFLEDIRRHLAGMPVEARPDTLGYRLGKLVRRHRLGVGVAAGFLLLIIAYALTVTVQADQIREERDKFEQVSMFLTDLFNISNPEQGSGSTVTARELLNQGAAQVDTQLQDQPEIHAEMLDVIGSAYRGLGLYDEALDILERGLEVRRTTTGALDPELAQTQNNLGEVHFYRGDYAAAESLYLDALTIRRQLYGSVHEEVGQSLNNLGLLHRRRGQNDMAEMYYSEALDIYRQTLEVPHWRTATTQHNLAALLAQQGDFERAEALYRETLELWRALYGPEHRNVALTLSNLGDALRAQEEYAEAEPLHLAALEQFQKLIGMESNFVAFTLHDLADTYRGLGQPERADSLYQVSLTMLRKTLPEGHLHIATSLVVLGRFYAEDLDRPQEAEPLLREALQIRSQNLPDDNWNVAEAKYALGACLASLDRPEEAEPLLEESYAVLRAERGEEHQITQRAKAALDGLKEIQNQP